MHALRKQGAKPAVQSCLLLIDDDEPLRMLLKRLLRREGFDVDIASDGADGLAKALRGGYDAVLLDLLVPGTHGLTVLQELVRARPGLPVIVVSAIADVQTKVMALEMGAGDYVVKPFAASELVARLHVQLRYGRRLTIPAQPVQLDAHRHSVDTGHGPVRLTEREYVLFATMHARPNETISKPDLLHAVWGESVDAGSNVLDVYIGRLRAKLGVELIETVRGEGYRVSG